MKIPWHDGIIFKLKTYSVEGELLSPLKNYLENREQRIVLNDQTSEWRKVMSGIPQGSVLLLCKMFVYDTSLFSKVYDIHKSASKHNDDFEKRSYWAYQWKMQFNPDPNKQANKVNFSR